MMSTAATIKGNPLSVSIDGPEITGRRWDSKSAYGYCEALARSHYENFPVGSVLVPKALRRHFYSIYAFARIADDFADEGYDDRHTEQERLALLDEWRRMLAESAEGHATHPVFIALSETREQFKLPPALFEDLLSAFSQDVVVRRYETFADVLDYCRRSANPIGRLVLLLFGYRDEQLHRWSDDICTALQLANHWQDVPIDLVKDRIYLPGEDLALHGISVEDLRRHVVSQNFIDLMKHEVGRARELFVRGKPLCLAAAGRLGLELRAVWAGGTRILDLIEAGGYDVFNRRPVITSSEKLRALYYAANKRAFRHR